LSNLTIEPLNRKVIYTCILITLFCYFEKYAFPQLTLSLSTWPYWPNLNGGIGNCYNERLWAEFKLDDILTPFLMINYKIYKGAIVEGYAGVGTNINYYDQLKFPLTFQYFPFKKLKGFAFIIEFNMNIRKKDFLSEEIQAGILYKFNKTRK